MYSIEDLSCAKLIKSAYNGSRNAQEQSQWLEWQAWADGVILWFKRLRRLVNALRRRLDGDYWLALKGAWQVVKSVKHATAKFLHVSILELRTRQRPSVARVERIAWEDKHQQAIRSDKHKRSQRCMDTANHYQNAWA